MRTRSFPSCPSPTQDFGATTTDESTIIIPMWTRSALLLAVSLCASAALAQNDDADEIDRAAGLFRGPLEVAATRDDFAWWEGPMYSERGRYYLLFSDVQWRDEDRRRRVRHGLQARARHRCQQRALLVEGRGRFADFPARNEPHHSPQCR